LEMARDLATAPTLALSEIKRQFDTAPGQTFDEALDYELTVQALMTWTEDFREGSTAFKEKRKPVYRGA
jgi:2-(1,2-epoxy-1,2-dihydrophenyl)acetyl-CoA isomerase